MKSPIDQERAHEVAVQVVNRVNQLEGGAIEWLQSFNKLIGTKARSIEIREDDPRLIELSFGSDKEASRCKKLLQAGSMIPFIPAQLELYMGDSRDPSKVTVMRQIGVHLDPHDTSSLFTYVPKYDKEGSFNESYKTMVSDRVETIAAGLGGASPIAREIDSLLSTPAEVEQDRPRGSNRRRNQ